MVVQKSKLIHIILGVNPLRKEADESDSEKEENKHFGSESVYDYANITNTADYVIKDELDEAQKEIYNVSTFRLNEKRKRFSI